MYDPPRQRRSTHPELLQTELFRWKHHWQRRSPADRLTTVSAAVKLCSRTEFPNVHVLLRIACTIPVTSCECERTASSLRRLQTFTRASMAQDRLSSLALIHIHYDMEIDLDEVVQIFSVKEPRRVQLTKCFA